MCICLELRQRKLISLLDPFERSDTGVVVRPIDKPQAGSIESRIRHYYDSLPSQFWLTRARSRSPEDEDVTKQQVNIQDIDNPS